MRQGKKAYLTASEVFKYLQPLRNEDCSPAVDGIIAKKINGA